MGGEKEPFDEFKGRSLERNRAMRHHILDILAEIGVVPVVRADDERSALKAAEALLQGGISICEITMTVPGAIKVIESLSKEFAGELTVGAGTVDNVQTCQEVLDKGGQFVVTPSVKPDVVAFCKKKGTCVIGGALSPTEILTVWEAGANAVKVFPVKAVGGPEYIRMIHGPFPEIELVPTGGVNLRTLPDYLKAGAAFVGAGGDLVNRDALKERKISKITERAREYMTVIRGVRAESGENP